MNKETLILEVQFSRRWFRWFNALLLEEEHERPNLPEFIDFLWHTNLPLHATSNPYYEFLIFWREKN